MYKIDKKILAQEQGEISLYKKLNLYLGEFKEGYFSYTRIEKYLKSTGNAFELTPLGYITGKVLISVILFLAFILSKAYVAAIIGAVIGYFSLDILLKLKDRQDMKVIRFELKDIYDSLTMQSTAGVYIGTALTECYLIASNKRFKRSLAELSAEISMTYNIEKSLDNFLEKFNSNEISNFVITIKQSLQTGQSKQQLEDLSEQQSEMNLIAVQEDTKKISSTVTIIQILLFVGILITVLYFTSTVILSNWNGLFNNK
jgi:tight adherence protein C